MTEPELMSGLVIETIENGYIVRPFDVNAAPGASRIGIQSWIAKDRRHLAELVAQLMVERLTEVASDKGGEFITQAQRRDKRLY